MGTKVTNKCRHEQKCSGLSARRRRDSLSTRTQSSKGSKDFLASPSMEISKSPRISETGEKLDLPPCTLPAITKTQSGYTIEVTPPATPVVSRQVSSRGLRDQKFQDIPVCE